MAQKFYAATEKILPDIEPKNCLYRTHAKQVIEQFVVEIVGEEKAPKVTDMLTDLSINEILRYLQNFNFFDLNIINALA